MTLGVRVEDTCPNSAFVCAPVVKSNRAVVLIPEYCVWLNALYISHRSWKNRCSLPAANRLENARSVLATPGLRTLFLDAFPESPLPGTANAAGLNQAQKVEPLASGSPS